jgi:hypothetical protein
MNETSSMLLKIASVPVFKELQKIFDRPVHCSDRQTIEVPLKRLYWNDRGLTALTTTTL